MKRTYYDAVIILKEPNNGIYKYSYRNYRKIKYKMTDDRLKLWVYSRGMRAEVKYYTNVASIKITKHRM